MNKQAQRAGNRADELHNQFYGTTETQDADEVNTDVNATHFQNKGPDFEQQYKTLQGKYNAEVPRLHSELKTLQAELASLRNATQAQQRQAQIATETAAKMLQPETYAEYGEEFETLVKSVNDLQDTVTNLRLDNETLKTTVDATKTDSAADRQARFYDTLTSVVPNWETINVNPDFIDWLSKKESDYDTNTRQDYMNRAAEVLDVGSVIKLFKAYTEATQRTKEHIQRQVQPNTVSISHIAPEMQGEVITRAQIREFYKNASIRKYTQDQVDAFDARVQRAHNSGNIR